MVRLIVRLTLCLVFGAAVTAGSAWGLALLRFDWTNHEWVSRPCSEAEGGGLYDIFVMRTRGGTHYRSLQGGLHCGTGYTAGGPDALAPSWAQAALGPRQSDARSARQPSCGEVQAWGWPARALWWERRDREVRGGIVAPAWLVVREPKQSWSRDPPILPLRPVWSGAIANTATFAGIAMALTVLPGLARRVSRRHAGRCSRCGYDLRGLRDAGCPECGAGRLHSPGAGDGDP